MKKFAKVLSLVLVVAMVCVLFASCGKTISGTYKGEVDAFGLAGAEVVYKFSGNKVNVKATASILGFEKTVESDGTYEITENEEGALEITFTFEDEDAEKYSGTFSFSEGDDYIKIGGAKYEKQ